jgi:hypothetical protein
MRVIQSLEKLQALALPPAQTAGATGDTVARARERVSSGQAHSPLKMAVPSKTGVAPVVNISSPKVARTPNQFLGRNTEGSALSPISSAGFRKSPMKSRAKWSRVERKVPPWHHHERGHEKGKCQFSSPLYVEYVGFKAKALVREYSFLVRGAAIRTREFTLTIVNDAFKPHGVRYQDAPDICSAKLHRELAAFANHPPQTHYRITEVELDEYHGSHMPKAAGSLSRPKARRES